MRLRRLCLLLVLFFGCATQSQDAFSLLPKEAQLIAFLDAAQLHQSKTWETLAKEFEDKPFILERAEPMRKILGVDLVTEVESISLAAWAGTDLKPQVVGVLRLLPSADTATLRASLQGFPTKTIGGVSFWKIEERSLTFISERELLFGSDVGVEQALSVQKQQAPSVLQNERLMSLRAQAYGQFFLVADVPVFMSAGAAFLLSQAKLPGMEGMANLAGLSSIVLSADLYGGVDARLRASLASHEAAEAMSKQLSVKSLTSMGSLFLFRNMDDWLTSGVDGQDWVMRVAIPGGQLSALAQDLVYYLEDRRQSSPYVPDEMMPPETQREE